MRRLLTLVSLALFACGSPSGPDPDPPPRVGTPSMAIVAGDSQRVQVTDTLPFDAEVRLKRGGQPVPDQLVEGRRVIVIDARGCSPLYVVAEGDTVAEGLIEDEGTLARYEITFHRTTDCRDL